ncbi:MAG: cell division ATP-binding protein FtsE [Candidatus Berkiella sp.]
MITFVNVTKKYPNGQLALNNISLEIASGEMVFLRGHSGAGKSTLLKVIAHLETPTRGQVFVGAKNICQMKKSQIPYFRRHIGYITQNPKLLDNYTVFENVAMPLVIAGYEKLDIIRRVRAALERVGLLEKEQLKPPMLSEGEQQRVGIARAVVHKPRILLADEPTGNLDPELSLEIMKLFERFRQVGVTVLIASHDSHLLEQFPYRKIHLAQGSIIEPPSNIVQSESEDHYELEEVEHG